VINYHHLTNAEILIPLKTLQQVILPPQIQHAQHWQNDCGQRRKNQLLKEGKQYLSYMPQAEGSATAANEPFPDHNLG
jgi:hypothetical protein